MLPPDDELKHLLREWRETLADAPNLASSVRREVRARAARRDWRARLAGWFVFDARGRRWAVACVVIGVGLGLGGVEWLRIRQERQMPLRYLKWIDPVAVADARGER
jgi:hypothetical protein